MKLLREELKLLGRYLAPRHMIALTAILVLLAGGLVLAYQFPPTQYFVDVGAPDDGPYTDNFHAADFDGAASYRISDYYSYVTIPGTGSLPYTLTISIDGTNPTSSTPLTTTVFVGGVSLYNGRLQVGWQELTIAVNQQTAPVALAARDVVVELRSQTYRQPDARNDNRGPKLDWVRVTPTPAGFVAPTLGVLLRLVGFVALLYLLLSRLVSLLAPTPAPARNRGGVDASTFNKGVIIRPYELSTFNFLLTTLAAIILVVLMIVAHQALALDSTHLLITVAATYAVLVLARLAVGKFAPHPTLSPEGRGNNTPHPTLSPEGRGNNTPHPTLSPEGRGDNEQAPTIHNSQFTIHNYLIATVAIAFAIKFGGMALPQTIVKDMPWHLRFIHEVKVNGVEPLLQPNVLSVTPREWDLGSNALIPKSPLFYVAMVPLAYLPGDLEVWVKLVICIIDVSGAIFLYYLARRLLPDGDEAEAPHPTLSPEGRGNSTPHPTLSPEGRGKADRAYVGASLPNGYLVGILAAAVYLLTPLSYRVLSFGTLPTIFAQWLTLLAFAYLVLNLPRLHRPAQFVLQAMLFALVLLSFPTMVLFTPLVLAVMFIGGFFIRDKLVRRNTLIFMPLSALVGVGLAVLVYYGRYIPGIINETLPKLSQGTAVRGELPGDKLGGWLGMLGSNINFYGSVIPLILAVFGLVLLFRWGWGKGQRIRFNGTTETTDGSQRIGFSGETDTTDVGAVGGPPNRSSQHLQSAIYNLQSLFFLLFGWLLIIPVFYVVNYRLDMIGKHLLYTMYPLALASGVALAWIWRKPRWGRWAVGLLLAAIGLAAASLWLERILYGGR